MGVAGAIGYLHCDTDERVVPRDIKPSNILLFSNKTAKVRFFSLFFILLRFLISCCSYVTTIFFLLFSFLTKILCRPQLVHMVPSMGWIGQWFTLLSIVSSEWTESLPGVCHECFIAYSRQKSTKFCTHQCKDIGDSCLICCLFPLVEHLAQRWDSLVHKKYTQVVVDLFPILLPPCKTYHTLLHVHILEFLPRNN